MEMLKKLEKMCNASVYIEINPHINDRISVQEYVGDYPLLLGIAKDMPDVYAKCIEQNRLIVVQAYPNTPIVSFASIGADLDSVFEDILKSIGG